MLSKNFRTITAFLLLAAVMLSLCSCMSFGTGDSAPQEDNTADSSQDVLPEDPAAEIPQADTDVPEGPSADPVPAAPVTVPEQVPDTEITDDQSVQDQVPPDLQIPQAINGGALSAKDIPACSGEPYVILNDNMPCFTADDLSLSPFKYFSELDDLGRCGPAYANICRELIPDEPRGEIGMIQPSGWHTARYDDLIEDRYLYNRCHLIGYQLSGENANPLNLITGTRYMNTEGMLGFENEVSDFVQKTGYHVLYRSTPVFDGSDLVASGVHLEAYSVEDLGQGVCFNVFVYNVQPGIEIDYATGESRRADPAPVPFEPDGGSVSVPADDPVRTQTGTLDEKQLTYILNTNTKKFHYPKCKSVSQMKDKNKQEFYGTRDEVIAAGYSPCGNCNP